MAPEDTKTTSVPAVRHAARASTRPSNDDVAAAGALLAERAMRLAYVASRALGLGVSGPGGGGGAEDDSRVFSLSMHAVIAIEPNVDDIDGEDGDDCLTQTNGGGLFVWSAAALQKLDAARIAGVMTLKEKQIVFALRMLQFTYELMMKRADCVPSHPFKPFMGRAVVLQQSRDARAGAPTTNT